MKWFRFTQGAIVMVGLLAVVAYPAMAQPFNITWNSDDGDYNVSDNWLDTGGFPAPSPPDSGFDEIGVIGNGGLSHLSAAASQSPAGIAINGGSTLELRNNGSLVVEFGDPTITNGNVAVNNGNLIGLAGSSLTAEALGSGGAGIIDLIGSASVTVNGDTSLSGTTRITGPDVDFSTGGFSTSGDFEAVITGASHSVVDASGGASLAGTLTVDFNGVSPAFGDSWDILTAQSITGNFANIASNVSPGPGLVVGSRIVDGGNGQIAQAVLDSRLSLIVNRRTGAVEIQDLSGQQASTIDGYLIGSAAGTFDPAQWNQIGGNGWVPSDASATHVGELTLTEQLEIAAGSTVGLGDIYANTARSTDFGVANEDATLSYSLKSGEVLTGLVDYKDAHNNVVLVVDEETGETWIQNQSTFDLDIDGYEIESVSGSLDESQWTSFASSDATWTEGNPASNHIGELNLTGARSLGGESDAISLGSIFTSGGERDLFFTFNTTGIDGGDAATIVGVVEYEDGPIDFGGGPGNIAGDYDNDNFVGQGDIDLVLLNWGADVSGGPPAGWTSNLPTGNVDQDELDQVLLNWGDSAALGLGGASAVPEPNTIAMMLIVAGLGLGLIRRKC